MFIDDNGVFHVLMYCCIQCDVMLLVYSDGENYAKYCSIKSNGGEKVDHVLQLVRDILENEKRTAKE